MSQWLNNKQTGTQYMRFYQTQKLLINHPIQLLWFSVILAISCTDQVKTDPSKQRINTTDSGNRYGWSVTGTRTQENEQPDQQIAEIVRRIFQDKNGDFWFGTNSDGICHYNGRFLTRFSTDEGLSGYQVTGIMEDKKGRLWIATNGGITRYDRKSFTNFTIQDGLNDNTVWSIFEDSRGTIWAGTTKGVCRFNGNIFIPFHLPLSRVKNQTQLISPRLVWCITEDQKGNMWFGTDGDGVCIYDGKTFRHLTTDDRLCNNSISCIVTDKKGNTWFSSMFGGVSRYDGKNFTNFSVQNGAIGDNEVWNINKDKAGNIWFTSEGFGVYRYDGKSLTNFSKREGLGILAVQSIYEDRSGQLWFGGAGGLYRFDGKTFLNVQTNGPWE